MSNWNSKFAKEGLTLDDVLLIPAESHVSPNGVGLKVELASDLKLNLPFISAGTDTVIEHEMAIVMAQAGDLGVIHKNVTITNQANEVKLVKNTEVVLEKVAVDNGHRLLVAAAVSVTTDTFECVSASINAGADAIIIDTAHGHSTDVSRRTNEIRAKSPDTNLIAGNVATAASTRVLYDAGVDVVRVGIGPGSIYTTHIVTGVEVSQIAAICDAINVAREYGRVTIADGDIKYSGDIIKVLAAGGNTVMLGSVFSGTHKTSGQIFENRGQRFKAYRGMGSVGAMSQVHGSSDRYFQGGVNEANKLVPEGVEAYVAYEEYVRGVILQLIGGLHAGMGYVGAPDLVALTENAQFVCITNAGSVESHPYDVQIIK